MSIKPMSQKYRICLKSNGTYEELEIARFHSRELLFVCLEQIKEMYKTSKYIITVKE